VEFPVELSGAKGSTLMWAQEHEVGAQALRQLRNIAALPWVRGGGGAGVIHRCGARRRQGRRRAPYQPW
jgi:hypothetical protein